MAQPHHTKLRARQAFHLRRPDGLLSLASFVDLAATMYRLWFCGKPLNPDERHRSPPAPPRLRLARSCQHVNRTRSVWSPGPSNQAYLSLHTSEATMAKTFRACSSPAPMQPSRILHLQYLSQGKRQSTPRCQSLITPGSDHPPVLRPIRSSISPLMSALTTHT